MIRAFHSLVYGDDPEAARAFFRDVLRWPYVDTGGGWLTFKTGPSELGVHPTVQGEWSTEQKHEISLVCDDIETTVAELRDRGPSSPVRWQISTSAWPSSSRFQAVPRSCSTSRGTTRRPSRSDPPTAARWRIVLPDPDKAETGSPVRGEVLEGLLFDCHNPSITRKCGRLYHMTLNYDSGVSIVVDRLREDGLLRFSEIDRSEEVRAHYRQVGKRLFAEPVQESVPNFFAEGDFHSLPVLVKTWQPVVDAGGVLLGAFDERRLAGIALFGNEVAQGVRQVALLFVSRPYRRRGVASALMEEIEQLARDRDARAVYVSSVPSESAVGFYLSRGFRPTDPLPEPFAKEPDDIHMLLPLSHE